MAGPPTWFQASSDDTVIVPDALREVFVAAQDNVRRYFSNFVADPATGRIEIGDDRYVLIRASALSTDFFDSIAQLYDDRDLDEAQSIGRSFLFDIAHTIGKNDARSFHKKMGLTDPEARLAAGPVHFSYSGWALVELKPESAPSLDDEFFLSYNHPYSFEADSWLRASRRSEKPVCIMSSGYSSGWCEESYGLALTAVEVECKARGDASCAFIMAPPHRIEDRIGEVRPDIKRHIVVPRYFERKREEDDLRRSEKRLTSIVAAMPLPVLITTEDGTLLFCNALAEDVLGVGTGGVDFLDSFEAPGTLEELFAQVKSGQRILGREHRLRSSDGTLFPALLSCHPVLLPDGESGMVVTALDVTEYKRAEAALRVNERMASVGTLAAGVAHEINNPLSYVIGNIESAITRLENKGGTSGVLQSLTDALEGAVRVRDIVRDLRALSREPVEETSDDVDVEAVLDSAIAMASGEWRHRAQVVRDFAGLRHIRGSSGRLGQVFLNLIVNAAQAIREGAAHSNEIRVATRASDDAVTVAIHDTGDGIPADQLERIFDPFFTTRGVGEGTGLGLSISRGIIDELGGEIALQSEVGRGTTVTVTIPTQWSPMQSAAATRPTPSALAGISILVVDDEARLTDLFRDMLSDAEVTVVQSGRDAQAVMSDRDFDVILCDLMMPDVTGMELYRGSQRAQKPRFMFMTGGAFTSNAATFLRSIANPCLEKPIELGELRAAIRQHADDLAGTVAR